MSQPMAEADLAVVRQLREKTGAGIGDCHAAIRQANGNVDKAIEILRKKGVEMVAKKSGRTASDGCVEAYIHSGGKIGVLIEVNCETDFVARTDDFRTFVRDLTLQIAAASPRYLTREQVPKEVAAREKEILSAQITGKPPAVAEKILEGKLEKFYEENCLMDQVFIKDAGKKIKDYFAEISGKLGEKIVIKRFVRYQLGENE